MAGKIVAFKPNSPHYGKEKTFQYPKGVAYAKINNSPVGWNNGYGFGMTMFLKKDNYDIKNIYCGPRMGLNKNKYPKYVDKEYRYVVEKSY